MIWKLTLLLTVISERQRGEMLWGTSNGAAQILLHSNNFEWLWKQEIPWPRKDTSLHYRGNKTDGLALPSHSSTSTQRHLMLGSSENNGPHELTHEEFTNCSDISNIWNKKIQKKKWRFISERIPIRHHRDTGQSMSHFRLKNNLSNKQPNTINQT